MTHRAEGAALPVGKLPPEALRRLVLGRTGVARPEVRVPAAVGEDAAVLDLAGDLVVASVDPITGAGSDVGWLAVHVSCNDVAAHGAEPVAALLLVLLPAGSDEGRLVEILEGVERAAREVGVQVAGGHTEVAPGLTQPLVAATVIGRVPPGQDVRSGGLRPGDHVWMTKTAGLEGTAILAADEADVLAPLGEGLLARARALGARISVVPEVRALRAAGVQPTALHDVTEGGVLGALWELAEAAGVGLEVDAAAIPVAPETAAICRHLGLDPLRLISSGVLLVGAPPGVDVAAALAPAGIPAARIARALPAAEGRWLRTADGGRQPLAPPWGDELWTGKERAARLRQG